MAYPTQYQVQEILSRCLKANTLATNLASTPASGDGAILLQAQEVWNRGFDDTNNVLNLA